MDLPRDFRIFEKTVAMAAATKPVRDRMRAYTDAERKREAMQQRVSSLLMDGELFVSDSKLAQAQVRYQQTETLTAPATLDGWLNDVEAMKLVRQQGEKLGLKMDAYRAAAVTGLMSTSTTGTNKSVGQVELTDIMSSMRRFLEVVPPAKTAKDIVFVRNGDEIYAFMIADGIRAGIWFHHQADLTRFIRSLKKREPYAKWPVLHGGGIEGVGVGGLPLRVADSTTWASVPTACRAKLYGVVDAWMSGKTWEDAWEETLLERIKL